MKSNILRQFPPCPIYDTKKMENWLEDLALKGWQLKDISTFFGYFSFQKAAPQRVHYRLEVVVKPQRLWDGDPKTPREEALALHEEFGWEFLLRHGEFFLYKSTELQPRELHTDPEVQALTLKMLNRRLLGNICSSVLLAGFQIAFGIWGYPFNVFIVLGSLFVLAFLTVSLFEFWKLMHAIHLILRQRNALLGKVIPNADTNWSTGARRYRVLQMTGTILSCFILIYFLGLYIDRKTETPLVDFTGGIPFITIDDLDPNGQAGSLQKIDNGTCSQWSDPLFPVIIDYLDGGSVAKGSQRITGGLLEVQYCEAISPWIARSTAREFARFYDRQTFGSRSVEAHPLPQLDLDYAAGLYHETFGLLCVVLSEENRTVCARFTMDDESGPYTIENWAALMAENLLAKNAA